MGAWLWFTVSWERNGKRCPFPTPHLIPHLTHPRTSPYPAFYPAPTPQPTQQRSHGSSRPIPQPFFARCPCPYTVEPYTVEALCTPLEQLWAGEIPRLEAEKRAAKQVADDT